MTWQPIETAPRDGTMVIVPEGLAHWHHGDWHSLTGIQWPGRPISWPLEYWQPLPPPPAAQCDTAAFLPPMLNTIT